jgi:hypothetical protein
MGDDNITSTGETEDPAEREVHAGEGSCERLVVEQAVFPNEHHRIGQTIEFASVARPGIKRNRCDLARRILLKRDSNREIWAGKYARK